MREGGKAIDDVGSKAKLKGKGEWRERGGDESGLARRERERERATRLTATDR